MVKNRTQKEQVGRKTDTRRREREKETEMEVMALLAALTQKKKK